MSFDAGEVFATPDATDLSGTTGHESAATPAETPAATGQVPSGTTSDAWEVPGVGQLSRDEIIKGYLRQQDYTRKTMGLAERGREFETVQRKVAAYEQTLRETHAFLQDRAQVEAYLKSLPGAQPDVPGDQLLTAADVQAMLQRQREEARREFLEQNKSSQSEILKEIYQTQYETTISGKLREIQARQPDLARIPGMEILLREAVKSQKPQSIDECLSMFDQAAKFYSDRFRSAAQAASVASQPNNPLNRGILPPTTGAPVPQTDPQEFSSIRDKQLRSLVERDLEALFQRSAGDGT